MPKFSIIPALFDSLRNALEKAPEIAHVAAETGVATGVAAALAPVALPLAIAGPAIVEQYTRHREGRPDETALTELFRKALLKAVKEISDDPPERFTEADRGLLELWSDGLAKSGKDEPYWARLLEEEIPDQTSRLIGLDLRNAPSNCPPSAHSSSAPQPGFATAGQPLLRPSSPHRQRCRSTCRPTPNPPLQ